MIIVNVNDTVLVKLTSTGIAELERQHNELVEMYPSVKPFQPPITDEDGYSKFQLHDLIYKLGHLLSIGSCLPFETNIRISEQVDS